ncbi:AbrB/MazE/SpoVT family DNA-binding domain-containing protein [Halorussus limi]|uniref:AbrB/MazE/SpoVT family DNA-binding domain-containing protein n=1 Tax=Halorussus limi TaxID=2938695 RepID=A0A8U0HUL0_9EURY|nr:AbrB/MazE/SpoVT family DNA-binding domain-containing protein [Halorussus limi]UPV74752.1 AbrB/MazE/SpoVT family DNA-binding domain-containing protein [Halorussus limi]
MSSDDSDEKILGTTTVTQRWRISLIKAVREEFAEEGLDVEEGDRLVYKLRDGQIVIEPA